MSGSVLPRRAQGWAGQWVPFKPLPKPDGRSQQEPPQKPDQGFLKPTVPCCWHPGGVQRKAWPGRAGDSRGGLAGTSFPAVKGKQQVNLRELPSLMGSSTSNPGDHTSFQSLLSMQTLAAQVCCRTWVLDNEDLLFIGFQFKTWKVLYSKAEIFLSGLIQPMPLRNLLIILCSRISLSVIPNYIFAWNMLCLTSVSSIWSPLDQRSLTAANRWISAVS